MHYPVAARQEFALRLHHRFEAPREKVFAAWTNPETLKRWWCPPGWMPAAIEVNLEEGGRYSFSMRRIDGTEVVTAHGSFITINIPSLLVYTWVWDGAFPDMPVTYVTVSFREVGGATEMDLQQDDLSLRFCAKHLSGWLAAFWRLDAAICP